jgi:hypothetical protein
MRRHRPMTRIATLATLLVAAVAAPVAAQTSDGGSSQYVAQPAAPRSSEQMPAQAGAAPSTEHLFGDWGAHAPTLRAGVFTCRSTP